MSLLSYMCPNFLSEQCFKMFASTMKNLNKISAFKIISSKKKFIKSSSLLKKTVFFQSRTYSQKNETSGFVKLKIEGEKLNYPSIWLRDNCQCEQCYHKTAQSRTIDWSKFDINVTPTEIQQNEKTVKILWSDGHTSHYEYAWLKIRNFTPNYQRKYSEEFYKPVKITWDVDAFPGIFKRHDYNMILQSDKALYDWIYDLAVYGVALITNTPDSEAAIDDILKKVGFPRKTHYGEKFIVQHVADTSNVAYLSSDLQMHTDLPYYEYVPGVNVLHCLVQTKNVGGENLLSDSLYVANYMKQHHFEEYTLLVNIEVEWSDIGTEHGNQFYKLYRSPVLCTNKNGDITRVYYSIPQRGNHFPCDIELVKQWYIAQHRFYQLSHKFAAKFKTQAGEILVFDNTRLLHGRSSYIDTDKNVRKIIGAYLDWDEIYSRFRCLKIKLG